MTENELYKHADEVLGPYLISKGFGPTQPADYSRATTGGYDRISVSKGPPSKAQSHFAVFLTYYPDYLKPAFDVFDLSGEDAGFPCGPYLNPVGVGPRPKYWSCRNAAVLNASLQHVLQCLEQAGLPWLESLRDPAVFAANVDPVAAIDAGLAHEAAGDLAQARRAYGEMMRRLQMVIQSQPGESILLKQVAKPFIFVARKLAVEPQLCEQFMRKTGYRPNISPLPGEGSGDTPAYSKGE